jgi:hypothetical protein
MVQAWLSAAYAMAKAGHDKSTIGYEYTFRCTSDHEGNRGYRHPFGIV